MQVEVGRLRLPGELDKLMCPELTGELPGLGDLDDGALRYRSKSFFTMGIMKAMMKLRCAEVDLQRQRNC